MEFGSQVHSKIAQKQFESEDPQEHKMLQTAKEILQSMPEDAIFESSYESKVNLGKIYGEVLGHKAVAILDVHWPDIAVARDWKTGKFHGEKYTDQYEIQTFFCGELFSSKYDRPLEAMYFDFLPVKHTYSAKILKESKTRSRIEYKIKQALNSIEKEIFQPKKGPLCSYCEYSFCCESLECL